MCPCGGSPTGLNSGVTSSLDLHQRFSFFDERNEMHVCESVNGKCLIETITVFHSHEPTTGLTVMGWHRMKQKLLLWYSAFEIKEP